MSIIKCGVTPTCEKCGAKRVGRSKEQRAAFDRMAFNMVVDCREHRTHKDAQREAARQMGVSVRRISAAVGREVMRRRGGC